MATLANVATIVSFVIAGAVLALNGIAPLTKTTKDDTARNVLTFIHDKILVVILPFLAQAGGTLAATQETKETK